MDGLTGGSLQNKTFSTKTHVIQTVIVLNTLLNAKYSKSTPTTFESYIDVLVEGEAEHSVG